MIVEFDPEKAKSNLEKHGVALKDALWFEWGAALILEDTRQTYTELRFEAKGLIGARLHVMVYCLRGDVIRVISLRKANNREKALYANLHNLSQSTKS